MVEQVDRDAAAELTPPKIRAINVRLGHLDDTPLVQAFRDHRIAAEARGKEAGARIVEKDAEGMSWSESASISGAGFELIKRAKAIRASIGQEHSSECPKCETAGEDCGEHTPTWEQLAGYWKGEAEKLAQEINAYKEACANAATAIRAALNGGQHE